MCSTIEGAQELLRKVSQNLEDFKAQHKHISQRKRIPPVIMDPLSISASAAALITICVQTIQTITKTIETVKTAKRELLNILNETNRMRLLLEQLRGLTHQLGSKNNKILLAFDKTGCEEILRELERLVDKLAHVEMFVGFQLLMRRSKFDALITGIRAQEDGIRTVLLSVATLATTALKW